MEMLDSDDSASWASDSGSPVPASGFPIGYTIDFAPEPSRSSSRRAQPGKVDDAPRGGSGSQVLPVAEHLGESWSEPPQDGSEYLYFVRQEARSRPKIVTRPGPGVRRPSPPATGPIRPRAARPPTNPLPVGWADRFEARFRAMRASLAARAHVVAQNGAPPAPLPTARDESHWRIYTAGRPTSDASAVEHLPKPPDLDLVVTLDQITVIALLGHFADWLEDDVRRLAPFAPNDAAWVVALLGVLTDVLTAEDISTLRRLARACRTFASVAPPGEPRGWMVVVAVARGWGQTDLLA